jgi:hypothetical protein
MVHILIANAKILAGAVECGKSQSAKKGERRAENRRVETVQGSKNEKARLADWGWPPGIRWMAG